MAYEQRRVLIDRIEKLRGSKVICYLTSLRQNVQVGIAEDVVRVFIDHLRLLPQQPVQKIDLFLVSNGGDGIVPWRLVPIFREYCQSFNLLIPFKAYSAATIMALGANEIVMHKFGALGPIDPTVTNPFNPIDTQTQQKVGISVEDVKAYLSFIKDTVGINHEEELVRCIEILANKVHPLALGNVERFLAQSRLVARKLLKLHTDAESEHKLDHIIEALASKLYFHGHPINRVEARTELGLKVVENVPDELETTMWDLFLDFEAELRNREPFDPSATVSRMPHTAAPKQGMFVELARHEEDLTWSIVESARCSSTFVQRLRMTLISAPNNEQVINHQSLQQSWKEELAPTTPINAAPSASPEPAAPAGSASGSGKKERKKKSQ